MSLHKKLNFLIFSFLSVMLLMSVLGLFPIVRTIIVSTADNLFFRQSLNHEKTFDFLFVTAKHFIVIIVPLLAYKLFSLWFSLKAHNSFINLLRVLACLMVYILHTGLFTNSRGDYVYSRFYTRLLMTPAWGGVWIFFILGGYLAGKSFSESRYGFDMKSIFCYYKKKIIKIILPTFSFIFLCCVFVYPTFLKDNPLALFKMLTFRYDGGPGVDGIGATWYVFTLVPLYLLCPIFCFIAIKSAEKENALYALSFLVFALGFLYRFSAIKARMDWYSLVYTPFYANIDLFFGGVLLSFLVQKIGKKVSMAIFKDISLFLLLVFILINSMFYGHLFFYQVFCPSIYLLLVSFAILSYSDERWTKNYESKFEKVLSQFSAISFEFYLFHSLILHTILPAFPEMSPIRLHLRLLLVGFVLTTICSVGFHRIFEKSSVVKLEEQPK